ncbi:TPA: crosslink repair DNA glycosylase YcaQ family protein [Streptococcus suis]
MNHLSLSEWRQVVLHQLGLSRPLELHEIVQGHNGIQAQFQPYADFGFKSRLHASDYQSDWQKPLVRQWSLRGTVHAYLKEEIPLYLHQDRRYFRTQETDHWVKKGVSPQLIDHYQALILDALEDGPKSRQDLKAILNKASGPSSQHDRLTSAWGGIFAVMVGQGLIYQLYGQRVFARLDHYQPWDRPSAEHEIARRYFSNFGPVSLADARYYFKQNKSVIEAWMADLPLQAIKVADQTRFVINHFDLSDLAPVPTCLQLAGFDALLLGFEKTANPFFDPSYIRQLYTMTGIVKPVFLIHGIVRATWRNDKGKVLLKGLGDLSTNEKSLIDHYFKEQGQPYAFE